MCGVGGKYEVAKCNNPIMDMLTRVVTQTNPFQCLAI